MFTDAHAHIYELDFKQVIARAKEAFVDFIICPGTDRQSSLKSVSVAEENDGVFACIGFHPEDAASFDESAIKFLEELGKSEKVVGIGEIGLDYHFGVDDKVLQKKVFLEQLKLAHRLKKPIVVHIRDAMDDALELMELNKDLITNGGVVHCFNGDVKDFERINALGLDVTIGGICTFKKSVGLREVIKHIPIEHILLETDTPFLTPEPFRGKVNEPRFIPYIAEEIAKIKNLTISEVAAITTQNARRVFGI